MGHRRILTPLVVLAVTASILTLTGAATRDADEWQWPLSGSRLERTFSAPSHAYGPGHRGIDLRAGSSVVVRAPDAGVVLFVGRVVDRGILTIDHGDGLVSSYEPVESELRPGSIVRRGEAIGVLATGGHARWGTLHLGVRRHGEYVDPLPLLGGVPRAVLLPCCEPIA